MTTEHKARQPRALIALLLLVVGCMWPSDLVAADSLENEEATPKNRDETIDKRYLFDLNYRLHLGRSRTFHQLNFSAGFFIPLYRRPVSENVFSYGQPPSLLFKANASSMLDSFSDRGLRGERLTGSIGIGTPWSVKDTPWPWQGSGYTYPWLPMYSSVEIEAGVTRFSYLGLKQPSPVPSDQWNTTFGIKLRWERNTTTFWGHVLAIELGSQWAAETAIGVTLLPIPMIVTPPLTFGYREIRIGGDKVGWIFMGVEFNF